MIPLKLLVAGPVGAGKSTLIRTLSEVEVIDTDEQATEDIGKETTTVAMDFGMSRMHGVPMMIYGTPGQDRFDFMWEILSEGALGLILATPGHKPEDLDYTKVVLETITKHCPTPFVVVATHQDLPDTMPLSRVCDELAINPLQVAGVNSLHTSSVRLVLQRLFTILQRTPYRLNPAWDLYPTDVYWDQGERVRLEVFLERARPLLSEGATAEEIIAFARDNLARFKVPRSVVFGPLPKTSTGKVQKYVLRERAKAL